jgi:hypothetical protein
MLSESLSISTSFLPLLLNMDFNVFFPDSSLSSSFWFPAVFLIASSRDYITISIP